MLTPLSELLNDDGTVRQCTSIGVYTLTYIGVYEDVLCPDCASKYTDKDSDDPDPDAVKGGFVHWEGDPLICDGCNAEIESEYGPIEGEDDRNVLAAPSYG